MSPRAIERCACGDTACPWCGPAQGTYREANGCDCQGGDDGPEGEELDAEYNAHEDAAHEAGLGNARYDDEGNELDLEFANPSGNSALRAATASNPRNLPCPTCGEPDKLTAKDRALSYQCDACADRAERGGY